MHTSLPKFLQYLWYFVFLALAPSWSSWGQPRPHAASGKVAIVVSVDWEGDDLEESNLMAMRQFRKDFPQIPLLQFLNAAYFTKPEARGDFSTITRQIKSTLLPQDEVGLHIHGWKSLFLASGVPFRSTPRWTPAASTWDSCRGERECGHDVPISAYTQEELQSVIATSVSILQQRGFPRPVSFRTGGWMGAPHVLKALVQEGFLHDCSAVAHEFFRHQLDGYSIPAWTKELWPNITATSQPYSTMEIMEYPNNGHLADYMSATDMLGAFRRNVTLWQEDPTQTIYLSIGFHQETAQSYLPRVRKAIELISDYAEKEGVPISWEVLTK